MCSKIGLTNQDTAKFLYRHMPRFQIKARAARIYFYTDDKTGKYETGASIKFCRKFKKRMNEKTIFMFRDFSERRLQNIGYFW